MSVVPHDYEALARDAVAHYWCAHSAPKSAASNDDRQSRRAAAGDRPMDGFCRLVTRTLTANGMSEASIHMQMELPGYFRPTRGWDLVVVDRAQLVAAVDFKSYAGLIAEDSFDDLGAQILAAGPEIYATFRSRGFGAGALRPWVGHIWLVEQNEATTASVRSDQPVFAMLSEFRDTSYIRRCELLLRKVVKERGCDAAALVTSAVQHRGDGAHREPAADLSLRRFLSSLGAQVRTFLSVNE